jgi:Family of unknown function (DUF6152)
MRPKFSALVRLLVPFVFTAPLMAHHATQAEFDKDKRTTLTGTLTKVMWVNPHAMWEMQVKDKAGKVTTWTIVAAGPGAFRAAGLSAKDYFKIGQTYTASIALARNGSNRGHIITWVMPDGKKINLWWEDPNDPVVGKL